MAISESCFPFFSHEISQVYHHVQILIDMSELNLFNLWKKGQYTFIFIGGDTRWFNVATSFLLLMSLVNSIKFMKSYKLYSVHLQKPWRIALYHLLNQLSFRRTSVIALCCALYCKVVFLSTKAAAQNVILVIVTSTASANRNMYTFLIGSPLLICVVSMTSSLGSYGEVDK